MHRPQPDEVEQFVDAVRLCRRIAPKQACAHAAVAAQREQEVVLHRMHLEHSRLLKFPSNTELGDLGLVQFGEVEASAAEIDVAGVRPGLSGNYVHHGGLAGAIRTDDGAHLARLDGERKLVQCTETIEGNADAVEIEQSRGGLRDHWPTPRAPATARALRLQASAAAGVPPSNVEGCRLCRAVAAA